MSTISKISITDTQLVIDYSGSTPIPSTKKYRGINLSSYDNGSLSGLKVGICTDDKGDTGGWLQYDPIKGIKDWVNASAFTVGGAGSAGNPNNATKGSPLIPVQVGDSTFATAYPQVTQINNAITHGVNIFRIPLMPTFMKELATGWAKKNVGSNGSILYAPGNPNYFDYYMTTVDYAIQKGATVLIDNHVYQRWCPTNIPGTLNCLEGGDDKKKNPSRNYSMDEKTDLMCPYMLDTKGVKFFTNNGIKAGWNKPDFSYIKGNSATAPNITKGNIINSFCEKVTSKEISGETLFAKGDFEVNPDGCKGTSGTGCYGGPTKKIIGIDCMPVLWYNLLNATFSLVNKDGKKGTSQTLLTYIKNYKSQIWLGLMNEPNEVNTYDLGDAYGKVIKVIRALGVDNTLLVEGNYWAGLHAQITPATETKGGITRPSAESEGWVKGDYSSTTTPPPPPAQIILDRMIKANHPNKLGDWKYDVHQYMDLNSTGGYSCSAYDSKVTTVAQMEIFTNFKPFVAWCRKQTPPVKVFVSEFGAQLGNPPGSWGCDKKLNLFLEMIESKDVADVIDGWTLWRGPPATSWATPKTETWTNAIMFYPLNPTNVANVINSDTKETTWKNLYDNDKGLTDPKSTTFCMPQLWALKGAVAGETINYFTKG
jgi:hypothetical protein